MDQPGFGSRLPGTLAYKTSGGGSRLAKKIEIFGFNGLLTKPWRRGRRTLSFTAGRDSCRQAVASSAA